MIYLPTFKMYLMVGSLYLLLAAHYNVSADKVVYRVGNVSHQFTEKEYDILFEQSRVDDRKPSIAVQETELKEANAATLCVVCGTVPGQLQDNMNTTSPDLLENRSDHNSAASVSIHQNVPVYYSQLFTTVAVTLSCIIFIFGILGNVLVVIVIARIPSMHTTTNCYLLSLAVADGLVLVSATLTAIPEPFYRVDEWPYGRVLCSLLIFLQYLGIDSSSLSITTFTIERYIAICHPMRAQIVCTVSRAKKIVAVLWTFTILYCSPWLGLTEIVETRVLDQNRVQKCQFRLARSSYLILFMFDLVVFYVTPLIIAAVLYLLIARILCLSTALRQRDSATRKRSPNKRGLPKTDSRAQVVRMLVVVVAAFASLWMPYRVMVVYNSFAEKKYLDIWFLLFARTMVYINCAINPVLYNIMSAKFRRAFHNYLKCWHRHSPAQSQTGSEVLADRKYSKRQQIRQHGQFQLQVRHNGCDGGGYGSHNCDQRQNRALRQNWKPPVDDQGHTYQSTRTSAARSSSQDDGNDPVVVEHTL